MKCRWYAEFEGVCTNGECPYRGDTCPTSEYPEVCKYAEKQTEIPQLSAEELVKSLRLCDSASCTGCALYGFYDCGSIINPQAADMLEKLAAERDALAYIEQLESRVKTDRVCLPRIGLKTAQRPSPASPEQWRSNGAET